MNSKYESYVELLNPVPGGEGFDSTCAGPGCALRIHESDTKETAPMIITAVSLKAIELSCACGNPACNFRIRYRAEKKGHHPQYAERPQSA